MCYEICLKYDMFQTSFVLHVIKIHAVACLKSSVESALVTLETDKKSCLILFEDDFENGLAGWNVKDLGFFFLQFNIKHLYCCE